MIMWALWRARNELVWNDKSFSPTQVINLAGSLLFQWKEAQRCQDFAHGRNYCENNLHGAVSWSLLETKRFKINIDAAVGQEYGRFGVGMVIRNDMGSFVEAKAMHLVGGGESKLVEAVGFREALNWVKANGWQSVDIETDALSVVQALQQRDKDDFEYGVIIEDCLELLSSMDAVRIGWVRRSVN